MTIPEVPEIDNILFECSAHEECHSTAQFIVLIHQIHDCRQEGLTPNGDSVWLMCGPDKNSTEWRIGQMLGEMYSDIPDSAYEDEAEEAEDIYPRCDGCGRVIINERDLVVSIPLSKEMPDER